MTKRPFIALAAATALLAGCGSNDPAPAGPAQPAKNASAYDATLMAKTERDIRANIRDAVAQRGFNVIATATDCVADTPRRFTCQSRSRVQVVAGSASCAVFLSEQRGVIREDGTGYWKSISKGNDDGTVPCRT